ACDYAVDSANLHIVYRARADCQTASAWQKHPARQKCACSAPYGCNTCRSRFALSIPPKRPPASHPFPSRPPAHHAVRAAAGQNTGRGAQQSLTEFQGIAYAGFTGLSFTRTISTLWRSGNLKRRARTRRNTTPQDTTYDHPAVVPVQGRPALVQLSPRRQLAWQRPTPRGLE